MSGLDNIFKWWKVQIGQLFAQSWRPQKPPAPSFQSLLCSKATVKLEIQMTSFHRWKFRTSIQRPAHNSCDKVKGRFTFKSAFLSDGSLPLWLYDVFLVGSPLNVNGAFDLADLPHFVFTTTACPSSHVTFAHVIAKWG